MTTFRRDDLRYGPPSPDEAPRALELLTDPETARWNPAPAVRDLASARAWCARGADWSDGSHVTFSAVDEGSRLLVANISIHEIVDEEATAKIGYRVHPDARGRGVATTTLRAVTEWAFEHLGLARIALLHAVPNEASCRVAERAGYRLEGVLRSSAIDPATGDRVDEHLHARLATDPAPD